MKKIDLFLGMLLSFLGATFGSFIFIEGFTSYDFLAGIQVMKSEGNLGKLITLGAILNLFIFFILLKKNKDLMARGIVFGTILLTIITLFV